LSRLEPGRQAFPGRSPEHYPYLGTPATGLMSLIDAMLTSITTNGKIPAIEVGYIISCALKGHSQNSHGFQPMEPAYQQQIRTPKGSTNQGILIGRPVHGRSKQLGGCPFPRVIRAGTGACPYSNWLAHCHPVPTVSSETLMGHGQGRIPGTRKEDSRLSRSSPSGSVSRPHTPIIIHFSVAVQTGSFRESATNLTHLGNRPSMQFPRVQRRGTGIQQIPAC
jgi:hypothetical protein